LGVVSRKPALSEVEGVLLLHFLANAANFRGTAPGRGTIAKSTKQSTPKIFETGLHTYSFSSYIYTSAAADQRAALSICPVTVDSSGTSIEP
jgi:hypothetical protein